MHLRADPRAPRGQRASFLIWGWAMLLVVLLSAAPTGGQVRTRLVGSAFDPATVSVAISPKQQKAKAVAKASARGLPVAHADGPPLAAAAIDLHPLPAAILDRAPLPALLPVSPAHPGLWPKAHGARAPPIG